MLWKQLLITVLVCMKLSMRNLVNKRLWLFLPFIILLCLWVQTLFSLYPGWCDRCKSINRISPSLSLFFALAMWQRKKGFGRDQPSCELLHRSATSHVHKATGGFTCCVNTVELTAFLFWCVVSLSLSCSPCYSFNFYMKLSLKLVSTIIPCMPWVESGFVGGVLLGLCHGQHIFRVNCWFAFPFYVLSLVFLYQIFGIQRSRI